MLASVRVAAAPEDDDDGVKRTLALASRETGSAVSRPGSGATLRIEDASLAARDTEVAPSRQASGPGHPAASSGLPPRMVDAAAEPHALQDATRYVVAGVLGEGGMGEVRLCHDRRIGRDVAMKIAKSSEGSHPDRVARFLREVRVQGQLEHPGVVPVYDLVVDSEGHPVFTMKRVRGKTLEEVVDGLRSRVMAITATWARRPLLAAFSRACLTVAFAHSRGVIHRDLKPANLMVGDFGEVYVLDWGIARIAAESVDAAAGEDALRDDPTAGRTEAGAMMGTPGYMAPEQAAGDLDAIGPATDVYALGAILFELLALAPLHAGTRTGELVISTLRGVDGRPSSRAQGDPIAPELDAICQRATALAPGDRFASARELSEAVDRFLDGERDVERRRELADQHLAAAREALASDDASAARAAMRELASALALDPTHQEALVALRGMVLDAPDKLPPEAETELASIHVKDRARSSLQIATAMLAFPIALPLVLWMGVRLPWLLIALIGASFLQSGYAAWMGFTGRAQPKYMRWFIGYAFLANMTIASQFGPWILAPVLASLTAATFLVSLRPSAMTRQLILTCSLLGVIVPALVDWHLIHFTAYEDNQVRILPLLTNFPELPTRVALLAATCGMVIATNVLVGQAARRIIELERRIFGQSFRLRQILPEGAAPAPPSAGDAVRGSRPSCSVTGPTASAEGTSTRPPA